VRYTIRPEVNYTSVSRLCWCVVLAGGTEGCCFTSRRFGRFILVPCFVTCYRLGRRCLCPYVRWIWIWRQEDIRIEQNAKPAKGRGIFQFLARSRQVQRCTFSFCFFFAEARESSGALVMHHTSCIDESWGDAWKDGVLLDSDRRRTFGACQTCRKKASSISHRPRPNHRPPRSGNGKRN
jgi:hypothetical protein